MARLREGDEAPGFSLPWTGEGELSLADRRGRWVILAFYPGDFTPTCTKQFCNYRDGSERIDGLDAEAAVDLVRDRYHPRAVETPWQRRWLRRVC